MNISYKQVLSVLCNSVITTTRSKHMADEHLKSIFLKAVESVNPTTMIHQSVKLQNGHLLVEGRTFKLNKPCYVVGFGKAVLGMAVEIENILGTKIQTGIVNVPTGIFETFKNRQDLLPKPDSKLKFIEGAQNNLPDENAMKGANAIKNLVQRLTKDDLLIVLISGGGSALLPLPKQQITLQEKLEVIKSVSKKGANIIELNCIRKKLSQIKGGGLARMAYPAKVVSLILSDIVGDSLDSIASGPTTPDRNKPTEAWELIKKYELTDRFSSSVQGVLRSQYDYEIPPGLLRNGNFAHVENFIIGNNRKASLAAVGEAKSSGYASVIISTAIQGDVTRISTFYSNIAKKISHLLRNPNDEPEKVSLKEFLASVREELGIAASTIDEVISLNFRSARGICLIGAGEPTVVVTGRGKGGRNQELALRFSMEVNNFNLEATEISFLSCGTDGIDGPTDAAGAVGSNNLVREALKQKINPKEYLEQNDSYGFYSKFREGKSLIKIGHTGTNVMDIHVMIIRSASSK